MDDKEKQAISEKLAWLSLQNYCNELKADPMPKPKSKIKLKMSSSTGSEDNVSIDSLNLFLFQLKEYFGVDTLAEIKGIMASHKADTDKDIQLHLKRRNAERTRNLKTSKSKNNGSALLKSKIWEFYDSGQYGKTKANAARNMLQDVKAFVKDNGLEFRSQNYEEFIYNKTLCRKRPNK